MATPDLVPTRIPLAPPDWEIVVADYPVLKELCWSYHLPTIPPEDAFGKYEAEWRHVDPSILTEREQKLIRHLTEVHGNGCFLG